jgi:hypothetical protein
MSTVIPGRFQLRRDTAQNWRTANPNPILANGEQGLETDTKKMKIGDGVTRWNDLAYFSDPPAVVFDGGSPTTSYTSGPVFDLGGVN